MILRDAVGGTAGIDATQPRGSAASCPNFWRGGNPALSLSVILNRGKALHVKFFVTVAPGVFVIVIAQGILEIPDKGISGLVPVQNPVGDHLRVSPRRGGGTAADHTADRLRAPVAGVEPRSLLEQLRFLSRTYEELEVALDPNTNCLWCYLRPGGQPSFTPLLVRELTVLHRAIQALAASQGPQEKPLIRYYVLASQIPGIYNMGGDLSFLADNIRRKDREAICSYAHSCVDVVFRIATGFDCGVVSIGLVQGDALGGGLEAALSCNFIVAERGVKMGLPEVIFNLFPGMGAYSMLYRRLGMAKAERIIFSGRLYSAEEMYELGVVDLIVDPGCGDKAVRDYIADPRNYGARQAIFRARQRTHPMTLAELRDITDMWVDTAMTLSDADLRRMSHLQAAQIRRLRREAALRGNT